MGQQVFQFFQPPQMQAQLRVAPAGDGPHVAPREAIVGPLDPLPLALRRDHRIDQQQQPPRLRRQLVERTAQHFRRQPVGNGDVIERDFDVLDGPAIVLDRLPGALPLMQQSDSADERQILRVVAPGPRLAVQERQAPARRD